MYDELIESIVAELTPELKDEPTFSEEILTIKVKNALREVKAKRNYSATSYTEEKIAGDLENYYHVIVELARYDFNTIGAEGETHHTENGVGRYYKSRNSILDRVIPFVKFF